MNGPLVWHSTSVESRILTGSALSGPAQGSVWALRHSGIWAGQAGAFSSAGIIARRKYPWPSLHARVVDTLRIKSGRISHRMGKAWVMT
jgi:hypothetical protein